MAVLFAVLLGLSGRILWGMLMDFAVHVPPERFVQYQHVSWVMMALMAAVVVASFGISYFVVSRINRIALTAHDIMRTQDLSRRIAIDTQWDDLSNLAQLLNQLLTKIEHLMTSVQEVSNNIAHDLRTPLAGLRSSIEALKGAPVEAHHLDGLLVAIDKIMQVFHALLRITTIAQGKRMHAYRRVEMQALLYDVVELYGPVAETKDVAFHLSIPHTLPIIGDADLLFQLFANLCDNAVKFSPLSSHIHVAAHAAPTHIEVTITDAGPGIPDAEKKKVFQHFYRGDASRTTEGNGLGLSLAKAIVTQHQGHIALEDAGGGLRVRVTLPATPKMHNRYPFLNTGSQHGT
jgi:signal transduction histidine kinase